MRYIHGSVAWLLVLLLFGCGSTTTGPSGTGPSGTGPPADSGGWKVGAEGKLYVPPKAKAYGSINGKKGDEIRVTLQSDADPVDVRLYLDDSGRQTDLATKEKVKETTLTATLPGDGVVLVQVGGTTVDTNVQYKMESRPARK
jgi:hypothetical protein